MEMRGENLIGSRSVRSTGVAFTAFDPVRQKEGAVAFHSATHADLERACELADAAFAPYAALSCAERAAFLEVLANNLEAGEDAIVDQAKTETGLREPRLRGELARTTNQIRMFARVVREGAYLDIRVDHALPDRSPPRPDIRLMHKPLGPVAIFGASNFPLAFSVAGGDTASALAAGCPVVAKAHPAHPGTSELVGRIIQATIAQCGLPEGVFSLLFESGIELGQALVADPRIQAVGFTGSRRAGLALSTIARERPCPIPVYAEMSSINPVILLPGALEEGGARLGADFVQAQTLGAGQFCTNPGLLLAVESPALESFIAGVRSAYATSAAEAMLTRGIHSAYCEGVGKLAAHQNVSTLACGNEGEGLTAQPVLFGVAAEDFLGDGQLADEIFGAASLLVRCVDLDQLEQVVDALEGQLTAAVHASEIDAGSAARLLPRLERRVGRVLFNGFGTGVEVCDAMVHGGPYPATSDVRSTSVGSLAIRRFLRPVCYQNVPGELLPPQLREENLKIVPHRRDGVLVLP